MPTRQGLELCKACGDKAVEYFARHGTIRTREIIGDCAVCTERAEAVDFQNASLEEAEMQR